MALFRYHGSSVLHVMVPHFIFHERGHYSVFTGCDTRKVMDCWIVLQVWHICTLLLCAPPQKRRSSGVTDIQSGICCKYILLQCKQMSPPLICVLKIFHPELPFFRNPCIISEPVIQSSIMKCGICFCLQLKWLANLHKVKLSRKSS